MPTLKIRIHKGQVEHRAEGFPGCDCQEVGEAYLSRLGLSMDDANEEPNEIAEETQQFDGG